MAGVRLEFAQFGHFDHFNIYRNEESTEIEDLGPPIGTCSTMYYVDYTVEPETEYYFRVGAVRDGVEIFSDEIYLSTILKAPYDVVIEFRNDETNRLELNWKLDGFVDEQRYYCSETAFTAETKPAYKTVLAGDVRTYIDTDVEVNKTYYIAVSSVKNGIEKLSEITSKFTYVDTYANQVVSLLRFNNNILDEKGKVWSANGTAAFETDQAKFNAWNITSAHDSNLVFDGDFTIEALVTYEDFTRLYNTLIASGNAAWGSPVSFIMTYGDTADSQYVSLRRKMALSVYTNVPLIATTSVFEANVKTHVAFQRSGSTLRVYKSGMLEASVTFAGTIHFSIPTYGTSIGLTRWDTSNGYCRALVDAIRITKGIARYNANFTPPVFL